MPGTLTFISYAREDLDAARRLYGSLQEMGLQPWLDVESLRPGQQWKVEVRRAIKQCRYFVVLLSSRSVSRKGFVHKELTEALELLDMYPDSDIYLVPVRLDVCDPPRERLRDIHWVDLFPDWSAGVAKLRSSFVLDAPETMSQGVLTSAEPLVIVVEKYRDSSLQGRKTQGSAAEINFSVKNTGGTPISVYDLGLEQVDVSGAAVPAPHAFGCRVTLEASLAPQGEDGETIPLFSAWCFECYALDRDTFQSGKPDLMLASPHHHEDGLLFHSVIGTERILHLAPGESESFTLKLVGNTGCATVTTQFRITALYHDSTGRKRSASSSQAYIVQHERDSARVVIATL